eukprot:gene11468-15361_t
MSSIDDSDSKKRNNENDVNDNDLAISKLARPQKFNHPCKLLLTLHLMDSPMDVEENTKSKVMHAVLSFRGNEIMMSDRATKDEVQIGKNIELSIGMSDLDEAIIVFEKLSEGGSITMPFEKQFWGHHYGKITDKFGINWMLSCI